MEFAPSNSGDCRAECWFWASHGRYSSKAHLLSKEIDIPGVVARMAIAPCGFLADVPREYVCRPKESVCCARCLAAARRHR